MAPRLGRIALSLAAALFASLGLTPVSSRAQPGDLTLVLLSTAWCHETASSLSMQTTKLRFQPNGVMQLREDFDMANGSHNAKTHSARWMLDSGLLIIQEPNGGQSRLPVSVAGSGRNLRLTLANRTYSACR